MSYANLIQFHLKVTQNKWSDHKQSSFGFLVFHHSRWGGAGERRICRSFVSRSNFWDWQGWNGFSSSRSSYLRWETRIARVMGELEIQIYANSEIQLFPLAAGWHALASRADRQDMHEDSPVLASLNYIIINSSTNWAGVRPWIKIQRSYCS